MYLVAKEFGQRPSELLRGGWADLEIDYAVLVRGRQALAAPSEAHAAPSPTAPRGVAGLLAQFPQLRRPPPAA